MTFERYIDLAADYEFEDFCKLMFNEVKERDNLTWNDVKDIINSLYDVNYTTSCYKSKYQRSRLYDDIITTTETTSEDSINALNNKLFEIAKAKVKLSDERTQLNALVRDLARKETLIDIIYDVASKMNTAKQLDYSYSGGVESSRSGLLLISDWHYGVEINNEYNKYNPDIAKERVNKLLDQIIFDYNNSSIKTIHVANLGDMIAGNIHLPLRLKSRRDIITQIMEVSEIIAEFLNELAAHFQISYCGTVDNHSRIDPDKNSSVELENLSRITDWYLRIRLPQVRFTSKILDDMAETNILGHEISFVHGNKDKQPAIISSINNFKQKHYNLICSAHMHHFSADEECNTVRIANGSLMGTDDHAYDLRLHSKPSQTFIEITEDNVVDSIRKLDVS